MFPCRKYRYNPPLISELVTKTVRILASDPAPGQLCPGLELTDIDLLRSPYLNYKI